MEILGEPKTIRFKVKGKKVELEAGNSTKLKLD